MRRFRDLTDKKWYPVTSRRYNFRCCDCGLTHRIEWRETRGGEGLQFRAYRLKRATQDNRRKRKIRRNVIGLIYKVF